MKPQNMRMYKMMSSSLWENNSGAELGEIKIQHEPVETVNIEMESESDSESTQPLIEIKQEIKDEEIQTAENDPSTNYDEDDLQIRVICEKIVRKFLAGGKKYCSNCYDIFENSDALSTHLANATANGNCSQNYSEQGPVDILNGCKINEASVSSTSSFSSLAPSPPDLTEPAARIIPSSISVLFSNSGMNNNNKNNTKINGPSHKCPFCPVTAAISELNPHIKIHITGKCPAYTCALCPPSSDDDDDESVIFGTAHAWFRHVKTCHFKVSDVKGKRGRPIKNSASTKVNEKEGKNNPSDKSPSIFACSAPGCEKTFGLGRAFKHHMRVHEGKLVEYSCQFPGCPDAKTKKNLGNLNTFIEHVVCHRSQPSNTVQRNYTHWLCTVPDCFNIFGRFQSFMNHVFQHKKRPFMCSICQMGFLRDEFLKRHKLLHNMPSSASVAKTVVRKRGRPRKIADSMDF